MAGDREVHIATASRSLDAILRDIARATGLRWIRSPSGGIVVLVQPQRTASFQVEVLAGEAAPGSVVELRAVPSQRSPCFFCAQPFSAPPGPGCIHTEWHTEEVATLAAAIRADGQRARSAPGASPPPEPRDDGAIREAAAAMLAKLDRLQDALDRAPPSPGQRLLPREQRESAEHKALRAALASSPAPSARPGREATLEAVAQAYCADPDHDGAFDRALAAAYDAGLRARPGDEALRDLVADFYEWTQTQGSHGSYCPFGRSASVKERKEKGCTCALWNLEERAQTVLESPAPARPAPALRAENANLRESARIAAEAHRKEGDRLIALRERVEALAKEWRRDGIEWRALEAQAMARTREGVSGANETAAERSAKASMCRDHADALGEALASAQDAAPWYEADGSTVMLPAEEVTRRRKAAAKVIAAALALVRDRKPGQMVNLGPLADAVNELAPEPRGTFPGDLDRPPGSLHTNHCLARMKWGDGECECGAAAKEPTRC